MMSSSLFQRGCGRKTGSGAAGSWVVAREIGGPCVGSEDAGQAVAAPPPVLGRCAKSGACDVDARKAVAAPPALLGPGSLLVRSSGLRGQGGRRTGGGSPTARAGSLREIGGLRGCGCKMVRGPP